MRVTRGVPELGQHSDELLTELGYGQAEIDALYSRGVARHYEQPKETPCSKRAG